MFFPPQDPKLIVGAKRRKDGVLLFEDAHAPVFFVYARPKCLTMTWEVKSAWRANSNDAINAAWWTLVDQGNVKDDLPQDEGMTNPVYLPTLTFRGAAFTKTLLAKEKRNHPDRNLYLSLLHSGTVQLNVQVNGEIIVPLQIALQYRTSCA